jgi:DNA-directed RNA polymerase subunit K/omega
MVHKAAQSNAFEFVVIAALRTQQLMRGCVARVPEGHKATTTAQLELVAGKVARIARTAADGAASAAAHAR